MPGKDLPIEVVDPGLEARHLAQQRRKSRTNRGRQPGVMAILDDGHELDHMASAMCGHDAELRQMAPQRIDQCDALANQELARPMQHQDGLLGLALHRNKPHRRPRHSLADRRRIGRIVLLPAHIGLHIGRRYQPHLMAKLDQAPPPIMRRRAGLHADQARRKLRQKRQQAAPLHGPLQHHLARSIDTMQLEHVLRQINADRRNRQICCRLAHGRRPFR
jgi:hypothetical protein